jgi:hypothetical protein
MKNTIIVDIDIKDVRNYFGEHDKTPFEHKAYSVLDNIIK